MSTDCDPQVDRNPITGSVQTMPIETIEQDFHRKVSQKIRLTGEGIDRFRVFTPVLFDDGDHLAVVLKKDGTRWVLSDEAHTYMHLTYDIEEKDLHRGTRQKIISNALSTFGIEDQEGELVLEVPEERYGDALYSFVQSAEAPFDVRAVRQRSKTWLPAKPPTMSCFSVQPLVAGRIGTERRDDVSYQPASPGGIQHANECRAGIRMSAPVPACDDQIRTLALPLEP